MGRNLPRKRKNWRPWNSEGGDEMSKILIRLPRRAVEQIKYLARREDRSQQKCVERILIPALAELAEQAYQRDLSMAQRALTAKGDR